MPDLNPPTALGSPAPTGHALAAEATPGRAACDAFWAAMGAGPDGEQPPDAAWNWAHEANARNAWEAAAQAASRPALAECARLIAELAEGDADLSRTMAAHAADVTRLASAQGHRERLNREAVALNRELLTARADLADAQELLARWPKCPDGCGCRLGTDDPDARECGCDGPCTAECRENGYPDALSYRDMAVGHAMDERDALQRRHEILKAALQRIAMGHKIGSQAQASVIADKALMDAAAERAGLEPS